MFLANLKNLITDFHKENNIWKNIKVSSIGKQKTIIVMKQILDKNKSEAWKKKKRKLLKKGENPTTQSKEKEIIYNINQCRTSKRLLWQSSCLRSYKHVQYPKDHWWEKKSRGRKW